MLSLPSLSLRFLQHSSSNAYTGIEGLGPLIIDGLKYGEVNKYSSQSLVNPVLKGEPKASHRQYLIQRSAYKFQTLNTSNNKGKAGFGILENGSIVIIIEEDNTAKLTYYQFRDLFIARNCIHALACDGSDSVFLYYNQNWIIEASLIKNNTQTSGIGFRIDE